jgi:hypothetical protein
LVTRKAGRALLTGVETGTPRVRDDEDMVTPVAAQEAVGVPPTAVEAGESIMKINRRRQAPVAAKEAAEAPPTAVEAGAPPV